MVAGHEALDLDDVGVALNVGGGSALELDESRATRVLDLNIPGRNVDASSWDRGAHQRQDGAWHDPEKDRKTGGDDRRDEHLHR